MYEKKEEDGTILLTGYKLKFYYDEKIKFSEAYHKNLSMEGARIVFDKLIKHYKLGYVLLKFKSGRCGSFRQIGRDRYAIIKVPHRTQFGLLCHEVAHAIDFKKRGITQHDKKLMRILGSVIRYCEKRGWWEEEIKRRTQGY